MPNYKSQVNLDDFYIFCFIYIIVSVFIFLPDGHNLWLEYLFAGISPIIIYFALALLACRFDFYDDKVILNFVFYFKKRCRTISYADIKLVRYTLSGAKTLKPIIILNLKKRDSVGSHSNSFSHSSFEKRKEILKFLRDKGLEIKISPNFNDRKELNILS